ncbi:MAG: hypothetical protein ABR499_20695 [Gemmatimonadaceae bacterium]
MATRRGTVTSSPSPSRFRVVAAAVLLAASTRPADAQLPARPFLDWRTVETEHFAFHYPRELEAWTLGVAERMESVRSAVGALVGNVPRRKVNVVVDDPYTLPNGFAIPPIDYPLIVLWTTPPSPRQEIGHFRSWGELLAVHEFAHVAHLTWPSRNPFQRDLWRLLPAELGPVLRRSPRWVIEGYATYVEGRITGSGRPYNVWRPAVLRQWALEGRLPTYEQLNAWNAYEGGAFAYLAGSAYLEWLARRDGDSSLVYLWRRLSARRNRGFRHAFAGLYGDAPDVLYGRFVAELTGSALAVERLIADAGGVVAGNIVQRLAWETGDPAISRDGGHVAVVLRAERRPPRLVVWRTGPDSVPAARRARRPARGRPADPLDVPDRRVYPPPKRAVATLHPAGGRSHEEPRFFADGERILVSRLEPRGDGSLTPDLFVWNYRRRALHRVTRGAGVRAADPAPDGRTAAGTRCARGRCDLVTVDLATGGVTALQPGTPDLSYHRPRYSPDGRQIAVSVQHSGRWRVGVIDVSSRALRFVEPDDGAGRYDVAWLPRGQGLVWVSERGGIPNVETLDLEAGATRPLTRVTGAALAPEPNPADGSIWFLSLHSRGLDVRRIMPDSARIERRVSLTEHLAPAVPVRPAFRPDTMRRAPVGRPRAYGFGPLQSRWFPGFSFSADGVGAEVVVNEADPVGRVALRSGGALGDRSAWRGAALGATLRRRVAVTAEAYIAQQEPSRTFVGEPGAELDVRMTGGDLRLEIVRDFWSVRHRFSVGGAAAWVDRLALVAADGGSGRTRGLGYVEVQANYRQRVGELRLSQAFAAHGDAGGIGRERFVRGLISGAFAARGRLPFGGVQGSVTYGELGGTIDAFERFAVGGSRPPLVDDAVLAQRISMPALPTGVATGERLLAFRVALPSGPLWPYYWGASAANRGESFQRWHRVVGAELRLGSEALPLVALPEVHLVAGYGRSLDPPYRRGNRFYAALTYGR